MFKFSSLTRSLLRGKQRFICSSVLAISSITCLTGCPDALAPIALPAGANGLVYLSEDKTQVVHLGGATGSVRTNFDAWIDDARETVVWVSKWGADKPWCSMVAPRSDLDWEALKGEGTVKPSPRLACISLEGTALPSVDLPSPFTRAQIDPSGKSVVFFNLPNAERSENLLFMDRAPNPGTLFNPKLAAVVDLAEGKIRTLSVEGFGGRVEGIMFPTQVSGDNQIQVGGKTRRLASFWARDEIVLIDLNDPELSQIAVSVRADGEDQAPLARLIPAGAGVDEPLLLVAGDSRDIDQIRLRPRAGNPSMLDADYSILTTVAAARDMELVQIEQEPWLLSATQRGLSMINLKSSRETLIDGMSSLEEVRTYVDKSGKTMVLGIADSGDAIFNIDPAKALTSLGRQPITHRFGHSYNRVLLLENNRIAAVGSSSLTVLDLESGKKTPLAGIERSETVTYAGGNHLYLFSDLEASQRYRLSLVRVALDTMIPESLPMEDNIDGKPRFVKINGGKGLAIPQFRHNSEDFGIGYIDANSASLADYATTWFNME